MIRFENVSKHFNGEPAVNKIFMTVREGHITCLIGPSGCGKTTTLKMVNRLIDPTDGESFVDDRAVTQTDPIALRRSIGYIIQDVWLFSHLSVEENVWLLETVKGTARNCRKQRVTEVLNLVRLNPVPFGRCYLHELSGGK